MKLIENSEEYWEFIRELRNNRIIKKNFIQQKQITREEHLNFMGEYGKNYCICLVNNEPIGFIGQVDDDIRIAVHPKSQGQGVGKFMVNSFMKLHPTAFAKVQVANETSIKLFESCGFEKKYYILEK